MVDTQICKDCGAKIDNSEDTCPYCGQSIEFRGITSTPTTPRDGFRIEIDSDGMSHVQFDDGEYGARPSSGRDSVRSTYSHGGGRATSKMRLITCPNCKLVQKYDNQTCSKCGTRLKS